MVQPLTTVYGRVFTKGSDMMYGEGYVELYVGWVKLTHTEEADGKTYSTWLPADNITEIQELDQDAG